MNIINSFVCYLCIHNIIEENDEELYHYGIYTFFLLVSNIVFSLFLLFIVDSLFVGIQFLVLLIIVRSYAGGYHSDSAVLCFVLSQSSILTGAYFSQLLAAHVSPENSAFFILLNFLLSTLIIFLSPQEAKENPLELSDRKRFKLILLRLYIIINGLGILLNFANYTVFLCVILTLNTVILLSFAVKLIKSRLLSIRHLK